MLTTTHITPRQVVARTARGERVTFVDARDERLLASSPWQIAGAVRAQLATLVHDANGLARDAAVVVYGQHAGEFHVPGVAARLKSLGFAEVRVLQGGLDAWTRHDLAVERRAAPADP